MQTGHYWLRGVQIKTSYFSSLLLLKWIRRADYNYIEYLHMSLIKLYQHNNCITPLPQSLNCISLWKQAAGGSCLRKAKLVNVGLFGSWGPLWVLLQVLMGVMLVVAEHQTILVILLVWRLWHLLLVADLPLVVWVDVDPFVGDPLGSPRHHTASMQRVSVLLPHPACSTHHIRASPHSLKRLALITYKIFIK